MENVKEIKTTVRIPEELNKEYSIYLIQTDQTKQSHILQLIEKTIEEYKKESK